METSNEISFSKRKNRCIRRNRTSSGSADEGENDISTLVQDAKELRKLRKRPNGVSAVGLALGKKLSNEEEMTMDDPFKMKTGGFVDMKALNRRGKPEDLDAVNLGNVFSAETNRRDEDADMMKYIDEELNRRKGANSEEQVKPSRTEDSEGSQDSDGGHAFRAEDVLFEHLRRPATHKSEEMLSNQMLSGIPEVDLGIEERIRNIEATEEAKLRMLRDRLRKKERCTSFVPTNMSADFTHHSRFNIDDELPKLKKPKKEPEKLPTKSTSVKGGKTEDEEKATDDFHFEKFKKQFRRF